MKTTPEKTPSSHQRVADPLKTPDAAGAEGGSGGFDSTASAPGSAIPQGLAVLVLVALVGGGSIMGMRQFGLGSGYTYDNITIDYPVNVNEVSEDHEQYQQILADLTDHSVPQIALNELREDPFVLRGGKKAEEFHAVAEETPAEREARLRLLREQEVQREFYKLTLNSVIGGSSPIARVAGRPVRLGDTVSGLFVVTEITGRSVVLEADGKTYTLTMSGN